VDPALLEDVIKVAWIEGTPGGIGIGIHINHALREISRIFIFKQLGHQIAVDRCDFFREGFVQTAHGSFLSSMLEHEEMLQHFSEY
jgi:hypothetical protein